MGLRSGGDRLFMSARSPTRCLPRHLFAEGRTRRGGSLVTRHLVRRCEPNGWTLIELLVVITIIIILIGLLFPAFRGVQNQAYRVQAKNDLLQIVTAVNAYYTEYGKYPVNVASGNTSDAYFGAGATPSGAISYGNNSVLIDVLRNNTGGSNSATVTLLNPRQIVFIQPRSVKSTSNPVAGVVPNGSTNAGVWYDPWGTSYNIAIDTNYDNQTTNPYPDIDGSAGASQLLLGVITWSYGSDAVQGTKNPASSNFKGSDDMISWQ
jgi:type II secretory pathway pseudopilin PulG